MVGASVGARRWLRGGRRLGPVDLQLGEAAAASILSVIERKKPDDSEDKTFILADVSGKAILQLRKMVQERPDAVSARQGR